MHKHIGLALILCILFVASSPRCHAQNDSTKREPLRIWLSGSNGISTVGFSATTHFLYESPHSVWSIRFIITEGSYLGSPHLYPLQKNEEYGLMYGLIIRRTPETLVWFSGGIGWVTGNRRGAFIRREGDASNAREYYDDLSVSSPGIAAEVQFLGRAGRYFGVGAALYANINAEEPIAGIAFCIHLGKIK